MKPLIVLEKLSEPRLPSSPSEDRIVANERFVAVIDGAGDPTGRAIDGLSLGARVAEDIAAVFDSARYDVQVEDLVSQCTARIASLDAELETRGLADENRPAASFVALSAFRREIWRVGDCGFLLGGSANVPFKPLERLFADVRSFMIYASQASSPVTPRDIDRSELERVLSILSSRQHFFENVDGDSGFEYGVIDGQPVPARFVERFSCGDDVTEVVLASDGYRTLCETLLQTESFLRAQLDADPLCIGVIRGQKERAPGGSYDDRSYVRTILPKLEGVGRAQG